MFISKLRKSSPREVVALLGTINLDEKLTNKIVERIRALGFYVLREEEVIEKKLVLKSMLQEQPYTDFVNPQLHSLFRNEIKSRGEAAVRDLIDAIEVNYSTIPILRSVLAKHGYVIIPKSVYWNLKELDDTEYLKKLENERNESFIKKIFGNPRKFERNTVEGISNYIDPPKDLLEIAGKLGLIPFGSFSLDSLCSFLFWHSESRSVVEIVILDENFYAVKGSRHFFVTDVEDFKSDVEDIGAFYDYLKNTAKEFRLQVVFINKITPNMIPYRRKATIYELEKTSKEMDEERKKLRQLQVSLIYSYNPFERRDISRFMKERKQKLNELQRKYEELKKEYESESSIIKGWYEKGVAIAFLLSVKSTTYVVKKEDLPEAIKFVLMDLETEAKAIKPRAAQKHRLILEDLPYPAISILSEVMGLDNPNTMVDYAKEHSKIQPLIETAEQLYVPRLGEGFKAEGIVVEPSQAPARAIKSLLERIYEHFGMLKEVIPVPTPARDKIPHADILIGCVVGSNFRKLDIPAYLEKDKLVLNTLITGVIGSGKTTAAKIIVERLKEKAAILIIDPTGAWKEIVNGKLINDFSEFGELMEKGVGILDLEKTPEEDKGEIASKFLENFYAKVPRKISSKLRFFIVIEEFHRLIPKINDALEKCMRELRKYGVGFLLISHAIPDIGLVRGLVNIRFHFRTGYEPDLRRISQSYGSEYARIINRLPTGVALFFLYEYNNARPYFIKFGEYYWRLTEKEKKILGIIENVREPTVKQLKELSGYGWSTIYGILRSLKNKRLIDIISKGRRKVILRRKTESVT